MSEVATARAGGYKLVIDDVTGTHALAADVSMKGVVPQFGEMQRRLGDELLPSEFDVLVEDTPTRELRDIFSGDFNQKDFQVTLTGPPGPGSTRFKWRGYVKKEARSEPLTFRTHPRDLKLRVFDGISSLRNIELDVTFPVDMGIIGEALYYAVSELELFVYLGVSQTAGKSGTFIDSQDLRKIQIPDVVSTQWSSYWDVLSYVSKVYPVRIYQDPFDRGIINNTDQPRWHVMHRAAIGKSVTGLTARTSTGVSKIANPQSDTISSEIVRVKEGDGKLIQEGGSAFQEPVVQNVLLSLPERDEEAPDEADTPLMQAATGTEFQQPALVRNGKNALRDGRFAYKQDGNPKPLYADSQSSDADVTLLDGRVVLDNSGVSGDSFWFSRVLRYSETVPFWAVLAYSAEVGGGSFIDVFIHARYDDGTSDQVQGGARIDNAIELKVTKPGEIYVEVRTDGGNFGDAELALFWRKSAYMKDEALESFVHRFPSGGMVQTKEGPFYDHEANITSATGNPSSNPAFSRYDEKEFGRIFSTIGEMRAEMKRELQPVGTKTLMSTYDGVIGPRTRIEYTRRNGTVLLLTMGGGRAINLINGTTDLADITVPST